MMNTVLVFCTIVGVCCLSEIAESQSKHPWLPPFGLDRVGSGEVQSGIEADAAAFAKVLTNPVDLGAILVPDGWLLLRGGETASINVAAVAHDQNESNARVRCWFSRQADQAVSKPLPLSIHKRAETSLTLPSVEKEADRDEVQVVIERPDGTTLFKKAIPVMLVHSPNPLPKFGAVKTKLRYDLPISVRLEDGSFKTLDYAKGWDASFDDVVVSLPNGARFVFWRGSCYVPFWAGKQNTGLSYEWAETKPPADGFKDCVEPLMDKELRYGRVEIIESTASRVHVRWTYQSCDFNYKVWGDAATEDFYFYPDGFGTRVLTLQSALDSDYELSEFIVMTPPGAYPFQVLPTKIVEILFPDGEKREIEFPYDPAKQSAKLKSRDQTPVYRVRFHKDEPSTAIYYHPTDHKLPPVVFGGFIDQGKVVTPCYWGSHWPLGRGQTTGGAIDNRIHLTPSHNSVMSWASQRHAPLHESRLTTLDTLGRAKPMQRQTWAWLIGLSDEPDTKILERTASYSHPPSIELTGARFDDESFAPERRTIGLVAESGELTLKLKTVSACVNPVFEISHATANLHHITINNAALPKENWAWDGKTLWMNATLHEAATIQLQFAP